MQTLKVGQNTLELSNLDKVLFPEDEITKGDLVGYYRQVAHFMLPHLRGRPITMLRHPDGIGRSGFIQKDVPDYFPGWIKRIMIRKEGGWLTHVLCENAATLVYLANQGCITPHIWLSRDGELECPDLLVFDLDPPEADFGRVRQTALHLRELLLELGLQSFVKTSGGRGLHVAVPLHAREEFEPVRRFARMVAEVLVARHPERLTTASRKQERADRIFIDIQRNGYAQTIAAPYAVRPRPGAPVSTPLEWDEVHEETLRGEQFTLRSTLERLASVGDPWRELVHHRQSLHQARRRLDELRGAERPRQR